MVITSIFWTVFRPTRQRTKATALAQLGLHLTARVDFEGRVAKMSLSTRHNTSASALQLCAEHVPTFHHACVLSNVAYSNACSVECH